MFGTSFTSQVKQYQNVTRPTWERLQGRSRVVPGHRQSITVPTPSGRRVSNEGKRQVGSFATPEMPISFALNSAWHPKQPSLWPPIAPPLHKSLPRASPEPRRILTVDNNVIYGEDTARLRWDSGGAMEL